MRKKSIITAAALALALSACQSTGGSPSNSTIGTVGGGALGAGIGYMAGGGILGTVLGGAGGGFLGHYVGGLFDQDKTPSAEEQAAETKATTAPIGKTITWSDPKTNTAGTITPVHQDKTADRFCRDYRVTLTANGETKKAYSTACKQPDGSWKVASN